MRALRRTNALRVLYVSEGRSSASGQAEAMAEAFANAMASAQMHVDYPRLEPDLAGEFDLSDN